MRLEGKKQRKTFQIFEFLEHGFCGVIFNFKNSQERIRKIYMQLIGNNTFREQNRPCKVRVLCKTKGVYLF